MRLQITTVNTNQHTYKLQQLNVIRYTLLQVRETQVNTTQQDHSTDKNYPEYDKWLCSTCMYIITTIELSFQICKFSCIYNSTAEWDLFSTCQSVYQYSDKYGRAALHATYLHAVCSATLQRFRTCKYNADEICITTWRLKQHSYFMRPSKSNMKPECGSMPKVMATLPNIGGALCSTLQSLADAQYWSAVQQRCQDAKPVEISWGAPN